MADESNVAYLGNIPLDPEIMLSGETGVPVIEKSAESAPAKALRSGRKRQLLFDRDVRYEQVCQVSQSNYCEPATFDSAAAGDCLIVQVLCWLRRTVLWCAISCWMGCRGRSWCLWHCDVYLDLRRLRRLAISGLKRS